MRKLLLLIIFLTLAITPVRAKSPDPCQLGKTDAYEEFDVIDAELYSFTEDGSEVKYALLQATGLLMPSREITVSSISYGDLLKQISALPPGSFISWVIEPPPEFTH